MQISRNATKFTLGRRVSRNDVNKQGYKGMYSRESSLEQRLLFHNKQKSLVLQLRRVSLLLIYSLFVFLNTSTIEMVSVLLIHYFFVFLNTSTHTNTNTNTNTIEVLLP